MPGGSIPRRSPRKRTYQEDEYEKFLKTDLIKDFSKINETFSHPGYLFKQHDDHIIFYKLTENNDSLYLRSLIVSESIRIYMLNYFIRVLLFLYLNGFVMVGIAAYQERV